MCKTSADNEGAVMVANPYPLPEPTKIEDFKATHDACGLVQQVRGTSPSPLMSNIVPDDEDWKNDARVAAVRKMMLKLLKKHLEKSTDASGKGSALRVSGKAEALAERLDIIMFKRASTLQEYANVQTLEGRINALLTHMLGRCIEKAATKEHSSREKALKMILGRDRLRKVTKLVKDIKRLRLGSPGPKAPTDGAVSQNAPPGDIVLTAMQKPLKDLFLNTPIVHAFELTSTECLGNLPWEELIAQGEKVVQDYQTWVKKTREQANAMHLTSSNIDALEHELQATTDNIIETFGGGFQ